MNYQNQNLFQPYLYNQNPYQISQQNYQQPNYQMPIQNVISGKRINRLEDITANDVPMDGSDAFFIMSDGSGIYSKHWNSDGTISTTKFLPNNEPKSVEPNNSTMMIEKDVLDGLQEKLTHIDEQISKLVPQQNKRTTKKDGESE